MTVMLDPLSMTIFDAEHSGDEDRWVSVGRTSRGGALLLVVHTFVGNERKQYERGTLQ